MLDTTLRNSHDLRVFGVGAFAEFASIPTYQHYALQRYHFYRAMEERFDSTSTGNISKLWSRFEVDLRQVPCLREDLKVLGVDEPGSLPAANSTLAYVDAINAADENTLIAHFYVRYLADLFGGSLLGKPTSLSLDIPEPTFYRFSEAVENGRGEYIESIYSTINECGEGKLFAHTFLFIRF